MSVHTQHGVVLEPYGEQTRLELAFANFLWAGMWIFTGLNCLKSDCCVFVSGESASLLQMFSVS